MKGSMSSLLGVFFGGVAGGVAAGTDSKTGGFDLLGEDAGPVSDDHGRGDFKNVPNSGPMLRIRLARRLGSSGKAFELRVPVLERRLICLRFSERGLLGATYWVSAPGGIGGASGAIGNNLRCTESLGRTEESDRVSPPSPCRSIGMANALEIRARARVVPESAEDVGVSPKESLEVNIVMESRGYFGSPVSGMVRGPGEVGENSWKNTTQAAAAGKQRSKLPEA